MLNLVRKIFKKRTKEKKPVNKYDAELNFWRSEIERYGDWYNGKNSLWGISSPQQNEKISSFKSLKENASVTWSKIYQEKRYLSDLGVGADYFEGMRVLDIGCGPLPSALCFSMCEIYGLDPLIEGYREIGFPIDKYSERYHFIQAKSEHIPFESNFFDAVISANAIDHVDDLEKTAKEIQRVLKKDGKLRMHVHYHSPKITEPIEIDDDIFRSLFGWVSNLEKKREFTTKDLGYTHAPQGEKYVLWGN